MRAVIPPEQAPIVEILAEKAFQLRGEVFFAVEGGKQDGDGGAGRPG
jgi:hypothetical protein